MPFKKKSKKKKKNKDKEMVLDFIQISCFSKERQIFRRRKIFHL